MEILFKGLKLNVEVASYTPARPAPHAATPDSPNWADPGDDAEIEIEVVDVEVDELETFLEHFELETDDELLDLAMQQHSEYLAGEYEDEH